MCARREGKARLRGSEQLVAPVSGQPSLFTSATPAQPTPTWAG